MNGLTTSHIDVRDRWVEHPQGRLFTRTWAPADPPNPAHPASPIVLFHDSLGCVALWRDFPAALSAATARPVIAYDRLGFGQSDARSERPSLDFVAEETARYFPALREQLGLRKFIALGHSVGGGMAIHAAAEFAADCEALVTIAAQVFPEDRTLEGIRAARDQFQDPQQVERLARYHGDKTRWVLNAWIENWLHPGFASWSLAEVLPRVTCPVLAIHGELDEYGTTRHPELIGTLNGGPVRVEILPGTGHVPHRERPETVLGLVRELVAA
ncbi:alpha/beta fold hydrolase [Azohydromonas caseinilytica]|uniref:Alpha/beta hydrolase n=1 Tax=Azohydromonas caseinilytica TaxID=2728836 RepID=A0A848F9P3_9BURK|nr:alpha/beta hydrolase [Azohydromonas caseinilytica]NML16052.1 alpha/beta hydrolase [Azohydromonas caseinilytica]